MVNTTNIEVSKVKTGLNGKKHDNTENLSNSKIKCLPLDFEIKALMC